MIFDKESIAGKNLGWGDGTAGGGGLVSAASRKRSDKKKGDLQLPEQMNNCANLF